MKVKEYIKCFNNHAEYEEFKASSDFVKPNVSHCVAENDVHYNKLIDYSNEYFSFIAIEDGTFKFNRYNAESPFIMYSLDNGKTWTELENNTDTPIISAGNKIMWKGTLRPRGQRGIGTFSSTSQFTTEGNAMSLLYGDDFLGKTSLKNINSAFNSLFRHCEKLVSAEKLSLPATTLGMECYFSMFQGCTSLTTAPELPAENLVEGCYYFMFSGCTSLNYIKCLATNTAATYATAEWVNGVAPTGTFVKAAGMSDWTIGVNGIPEGWIVEEEIVSHV